MPTYEYQCTTCGSFESLRPIAQRDTAACCPACGKQAARIILSAPALQTLSGQSRLAHATNERASHAPKTVGEYRALKHAPGCGCCSSRASGATVRSSDGAKAFPSKRPWMISH